MKIWETPESLKDKSKEVVWWHMTVCAELSLKLFIQSAYASEAKVIKYLDRYTCLQIILYTI